MTEQDIKTQIDEYYSELKFIKQEDREGKSFYVTKIFNFLSFHQYVFLICPGITIDPIGAERRAQELPWKCIQTRTHEKELIIVNDQNKKLALKMQRHNKSANRNLLNSSIFYREVEDKGVRYFSDQLSVLMLRDKKGVSLGRILKLRRALETYECIACLV